ncbi:MAG TPA: hypothetical protein PLA97_09625 [Rubrivivax sp.]|nr:hypothetical protein [Rubrivivax sp.]
MKRCTLGLVSSNVLLNMNASRDGDTTVDTADQKRHGGPMAFLTGG